MVRNGSKTHKRRWPKSLEIYICIGDVFALSWTGVFPRLFHAPAFPSPKGQLNLNFLFAL